MGGNYMSTEFTQSFVTVPRIYFVWREIFQLVIMKSYAPYIYKNPKGRQKVMILSDEVIGTMVRNCI